MSIAIICPNRDVSDWVTALHMHEPLLKIEVWPEIADPRSVEFVLTWSQPAGVLQQFPNLKCISSLGAGVNHVLNDVTCPPEIPLVRVIDHNLKQSMSEYVMHGVLEHFRRFDVYRQQQARSEWAIHAASHIAEVGIGVMGCGELGGYVAAKLANFGFRVYGWTRCSKQLEKIMAFAGPSQMGEFLKKAHILICLLPLTPETKQILNIWTFRQLPPNAFVINVARGDHLVEADLLEALDNGLLSGALLDVFRDEPLPQEHPFWAHKLITLTPHIASVTNPCSAAPQIVENYRRAITGRRLLNLVDRQRGY
jgi:glyoxylate/hydroxypyruvate reductase A